MILYLNTFLDRLLSMLIKDEILENCNLADALEAHNGKHPIHRTLSTATKTKRNARAHDRNKYYLSAILVNCIQGSVKYIEINHNEVNTIYVGFDCC